MGKYAESAEWSDIVPLPQNDGPGQPLAAILYPEAYSEAMSYLRAVIAKQETSERVLDLTEDIISMNPAHYTVWLYRAKTVFAIGRSPLTELDWLNPIALRHLKNYQIWHHRQSMIDRLSSPPASESAFLSQMFAQDSKNYHVWSYRQWLVKRFGLWDDPGEWKAVETLLERDVRNNSAWNHRWFLNFGRPATQTGEGGEGVREALEEKERVDKEVEYVEQAIAIAPQNASPWNYLRGLVREAKGPASLPLISLKPFAAKYAPLDSPDNIQSSHALDLLADIHAEEERAEEAGAAWDLLAERYDPIRANYWMWKKDKLGSTTPAVGAA